MAFARNSSFRIKVFFAVLALILFVSYGPSSLFGDSNDYGNVGGYSIRSTHSSTPLIQGLPMTQVLAHQPGYSVVENLYWQNKTFIFLTDQPWSIPPEKHLVSYGFEKKTPAGHTVMKILAIRGKPVSNEVQEKMQLGNTVTLSEAMQMVEQSEELPSPMLLNNDDNFINHYYHWIGEMFLGAWRVWNNYAWRTGKTLPPLKTVAFLQQWHKSEAPAGSRPNDIWEDRLGTNQWYTSKFFPGVTIESRSTWQKRAETNKVYRIPQVILVDRGAGHRGPSAAWKPFGDVLRLPVSPDWLQNLRQRILKGSRNALALSALRPKGGKPVITYLERQSTTRRLNDQAHESLQRALQRLHDEGLAEYKMESFGTVTGVSTPFEMQVATVARTDILVSVHGNGLTHLLWMDPGQNKIVFEMAAKGCVPTDYSALARATGVQYFLVNKDTLCTPDTCPPRGCVGGAKLNGVDIELDPETIVDEIRAQLSHH